MDMFCVIEMFSIDLKSATYHPIRTVVQLLTTRHHTVLPAKFGEHPTTGYGEHLWTSFVPELGYKYENLDTILLRLVKFCVGYGEHARTR